MPVGTPGHALTVSTQVSMRFSLFTTQEEGLLHSYKFSVISLKKTFLMPTRSLKKSCYQKYNKNTEYTLDHCLYFFSKEFTILLRYIIPKC